MVHNKHSLPKMTFKTASILHKQEKISQVQVSNLLHHLSLYSNNFHVIKNASFVISLQKDENGMVVRDKIGQILISANSKGVSCSISSEKIDFINQLLQLHFQQKQVKAIAPILKKYLESNKTNKIDRDDISLFFEPQTETIYYRDKKQPENKLSAVLIGSNWKNLISNLANRNFLSF